MTVRPLRDLLYVERVRREKTAGGIVIPQTFDHRHRPSLKFGAIADHFEAKVLAVGPDVREVRPGDHVLVWTYAGAGEKRLWTGEPGDSKDRLFVRCPDDVVCAIDLEEAAQ